MQLNFRQYSAKGQPLLILHGLFGSLTNWGSISKQLAESYAVYGVDLRNHGESPHADGLNYQVMAEDVRQLMGQLGIVDSYLIGHSMGGKVAMQLALSHPDLVRKLIVVDIAPVTYPSTADGYLHVLTGMESLDLNSLNNRAEAEQHLSGFISDKATRKFVMTNLVRSEAGKYSWRLNLPAIRQHYDRLREKPDGSSVFVKPVLFVKGALSNYIQPRNEEEILELFPNATVKIILQAGHWLHAEKPKAFQKIALDFLSRTEE